MGFKLVSGFPESYSVEATVAAGVAIAEGDVLAFNGNELVRATATSTIHSIFGVAAETISTTATTIKVIPFVDGQIWQADMKNNTAADQLYEGMILEDHDSIDNTGTTVTGPTAVFTPIAIVGAASDKKMLGFFHHLHPTST